MKTCEILWFSFKSLILPKLKKGHRGSEKGGYGTANRINHIYGSCGYQPVILIDRPVDQCEKSAYYAMPQNVA